MSSKRKITVAYGDGIGPEIMKATLDILEAAGAQIETDVIEIGEQVYLKGISSGIEDSAWQSLREIPDHHSAGRRVQKLERNHKKDFGTFCKREALQSLPPFYQNPFPSDRHGHCQGKRRRSLCGYRTPPD
jgi:isocitrate dehydrogenase